jgi:hypothetical protein
MKILEKYQDLKPKNDGGKVFKFSATSDILMGRFTRRRVGIETKMGQGNAVDVDILESSTGQLGPHTLFESSHLTQIFDKEALTEGDCFVLRLAEITSKGFKKFAFQLVDEDGEPVEPVAETSDGNGASDDIPF